MWNFEEEHFEIKCLAKKYPILVDKHKVAYEDPAYPLKSGQIISISSESFFFLLPASGPGEKVSKTTSTAIQEIIGEDVIMDGMGGGFGGGPGGMAGYN